ncbi:MAG TPA: STAS domain-containing protein [Bryobacteraceae bacterium]|jgi:anti-sigma B factor antagonist|nr:STAS domain-containing protein [Bryobacteraceae bacterium]
MGASFTPNFGEGAEIAARQAGDVAIVDVSGRLTIGPALIHLANVIQTTLDAGTQRILLNLAGVTYIDSSGIGELNATLKSVVGRGGALKLLQASKRVQDLLRMVGVHPLFSFEQREDEALRHFSGT